MKRRVLKKGIFILLFVFTSGIISFSQTVTGIWRGYFIGNGGEQYRLEFQVDQNANGSVAVKGVSYSWQDDIRFYGKATMTGSYVNTSQNFRIREIKTVELKNPGGGTCIMNYDLRYSQSGKEEFLEGTYLGKPEVKGRPNPYEWGDCGGGRVFLRKVTTTDFYVEPFLRKDKTITSPKTNTNPPLVNNPPATVPKTNPPTTKSSTTKPNTTKPINKSTTTPNNNNNTAKPKTNLPPTVTDTIAKKDVEIKRQPPVVVKPVIPTPEVLKTRQNELMKSLVVTDPNVTVKLYDNGEIDDDTISVYLDKKLVLSAKRLTASPLTIKIKMDEDNPEHELVMVAENLGRIPPNTSLMIVEAGDQRFDVRITSTEQKNAVVKFRYQKE